ncbi:DoxX family protein [Thalassotalea sp. M1531]|uniref:DoxX family protein n=1 Tax=Thalassotalea algicola TaxID=2716224 RepID=A0A7Y0LCU0_9GAMM|nr:DoxX family protein [Thalassotalea algicola]NMP31291.1 DoxX family protein [Thalassotalea algicola]
MTSTLALLRDYYNQYFGLTTHLHTPALLLARVYISWIFFKAGLVKLRDWDSTLMLFEYEYQVPLLPFEIAAYLATAGELILPILLTIGLLTKLSSLGLFVINLVAVIAYLDMTQAALNQHIFWGALMLMITLFGSGDASLDKRFKIT